MTARKAALKALISVERDSAYSNIAFDRVAADSGLSRQEDRKSTRLNSSH